MAKSVRARLMVAGAAVALLAGCASPETEGEHAGVYSRSAGDHDGGVHGQGPRGNCGRGHAYGRLQDHDRGHHYGWRKPIPNRSCPHDCCVRPLESWKAYPDAWPVEELTVGLTHYTQPELLDILEMDPTTDGSVRLAQQYIVTLLNLEANAPNGSRCLPSDVETALLDAGDFLGRMADADLRIPYGLAPSAGAYLADRLADFNEGRTDAPLCRGRPGSP